MNEDIGKLIGNGFGIWRKNINLCIPFLLAIIFSLAAFVPLVAALAITFGSVPDLASISSPQEAVSKLGSFLPGLALAFLLLIVVLSMVNSFFASGAIAMAELALREGKTSTHVMWQAGKRHFWDMFAATILMTLVMLAGFIFLLPGFISLPLSTWTNPSDNPQAFGLLAFGALVLVLYLFAMSLVLAIAPYALVVDILGPIKAIKASMRFFSYNKFDVFIMWIIVIAITLGFQMIGSSLVAVDAQYFQMGWSLFTTVINLLVLAPLSTMWWTGLYMSRTGKRLYQEGAYDTYDEPK